MVVKNELADSHGRKKSTGEGLHGGLGSCPSAAHHVHPGLLLVQALLHLIALAAHWRQKGRALVHQPQ